MRPSLGIRTSIILMISDFVILAGSFYAAFLLRNLIFASSGIFAVWKDYEIILELEIVLGICLFFFMRLYPGYGMTAVKELEILEKSIFLLFLLTAGFSYLLKPLQASSRLILILSWALVTIILPIIHFAIRNVISRSKWYGYPVLIFGDDEWGKNISDMLHRIRRLGWRVQKVYPLRKIHSLNDLSINSDIAILALSAKASFHKHIHLLNQSFRKVVLIDKNDHFGAAMVEAHDIDSYLALEYHFHLLDTTSLLLKNIFDFVISLILIILFSPILILIVIIIKLDSPGPIFFIQKRLGKNMQEINIIKFRTMRINAEQHLEKIIQTDSARREEYQKYHKLRNDPRITRFGKWLRRYSLDEIPQLINVLKGQMSLVGPRAYMVSEKNDVGKYTSIILRVKPGMTGWWQVMERNHASFLRRLEMDEYYISNWTMWMDFYLLMKTFGVIFKGSGT